MRTLFLLGVVLGAMMFVPMADAQIVKNITLGNETSYANIDDTWLDSGSPNSLNGQFDFWRIRPTNNERGIIRVNMSSVTDISSVLNATLYVPVTQSGNAVLAGYNVTDNVANLRWNESTITYNLQPCGNSTAWLNASCSQTSVDGNHTILGKTGEYESFNVTSLVDSIKSASDSNRAFTIVFNKSDGSGADTVFGTEERTNSSQRPFLYLSYVSQGGIAECTGSAAEQPVMGLFTYNETTRGNGTSDIFFNTSIDAIITVYNGSQVTLNPLSLRNQTSYYICTGPGVSAVADIDLRYYYSGSSTPRSYFFTNVTLNSTVQETKLFELSGDPDAITGLARRVKVIVKDSSGSLLDGYVTKHMRYYQDVNSFETVAMTRSDFVGEDITYLQANDVFYKFIVEKAGVVKATYTPFTIKCADLTDCVLSLVVELGNPVELFRYTGKIAHSCSYLNSTLTLTCTFTDVSGLSPNICLDIEETSFLHPIQTSSSCVASSAGTVGYTFSSFNSSKSFIYSLTAQISGLEQNIIPLESGGIQWTGAPVAGMTGILMAFIVIGTIALLGLFNPTIGILLTLGAMGAMQMLGLLDIGIGGMGSLVAVGLFILWWIRRDKK